MVDIAKHAEHVEETTLEPQFDEKEKNLCNEDFWDLMSIDEEEISTTTSRCPGKWGMYKWVMMSFGAKNDGTTYKKVRKVITSEQNSWNKITVYSAEMK